MDNEEKRILKKIEKQVQENNDILRSMRSNNRWSKFFKLVYWIVIIVAGLFVWSLIKPVIIGFSDAVEEVVETKDELTDSISEASKSLKSVKDSTSSFIYFFDNLKK